jgi:hypothetical protein
MEQRCLASNQPSQQALQEVGADTNESLAAICDSERLRILARSNEDVMDEGHLIGPNEPLNLRNWGRQPACY